MTTLSLIESWMYGSDCKYFKDEILCAKVKNARMCKGDSGGFWGTEVDRSKGYVVYTVSFVSIAENG